ncbi:MAG: hypothetical protein PHI18_10440, partial [bacterium]|nr:hypothetical protein [bacterium]
MNKLIGCAIGGLLFLSAGWCRAEEIPFSVYGTEAWQSAPIFMASLETSVSFSNLSDSVTYWSSGGCWLDPCGVVVGGSGCPIGNTLPGG